MRRAEANARQALEMLYAIAYLGAVALPLFPEVPLEVRVDLIGRYAAHWLIAGDAGSKVAAARVLDARSFDAGDPRYDTPAAPRADRPEAPFAYLFTSGTTGVAKVLLPTHAQLYGNSRAGALSIGMDGSDRLMAARPWPSSVGLRYLFRAHAVGAAFVCAPVEESRAELAATLSRHSVTRMSITVAGAPGCCTARPPDGRFPHLRSMQVIGSFISREERAVARTLLTPNVYVGYGSNEIGAVTLLAPAAAMPAPGFVGPLVEGMEARADGPQGERLPAGEVGDLGFRAAWMCTGYAGNEQVTHERFRDGWFYPGDAGSVDADGNVTLRGRTQEVVNYGGLKIWPDEIEAVLKQHPDVLDAALVGVPDPLSGQLPVAFVVLRQAPDAQLTEAALRIFCAARVDATRVPPHFLIATRIPRNEAGKIMRQALVDACQRARGYPAARAASGRAGRARLRPARGRCRGIAAAPDDARDDG